MTGRRYEVQEPLGRGGFGTVYRARFLGEGGFWKPVALKVLNAGVADNPEVAQRLRDEARVLGMLQHRAIVAVDRLVYLGGRWAVVMEYVEGVDLAMALQAGPMPATVALEVVGEVAAALDAAWHQPGNTGQPLRLQHRDIKPSNIQITAKGEVKVLDFGIARADYDDREAMTRSLMFGSPQYMAPERLAMENSDSGDVYSLGAVLYELLTAQRLGQTAPEERRHLKRLGQAVGRLAAAGVPRPVCTLVANMLAYEAEERPTTDSLVEACEALRTQLEGPRLRQWAREVVPGLRQTNPPLPPDELSGAMLLDEGRTDPRGMGGQIEVSPAARRRTSDLVGVRALAASVAALAFATVLTPGALGLLWWRSQESREVTAIEAPVVAQASAAVAPVLAPTSAEASVAAAPASGSATAAATPRGSSRGQSTGSVGGSGERRSATGAETGARATSPATPESPAPAPSAPRRNVQVAISEAPDEQVRFKNAEHGTIYLPGKVAPGTWEVELQCRGAWVSAGQVYVAPSMSRVDLKCSLPFCSCRTL